MGVKGGVHAGTEVKAKKIFFYDIRVLKNDFIIM
jgi:hypothetical protein